MALFRQESLLGSERGWSTTQQDERNKSDQRINGSIGLIDSWQSLVIYSRLLRAALRYSLCALVCFRPGVLAVMSIIYYGDLTGYFVRGVN